MANDTDQLVVAHLREIHAQLQGVSTKLEEHDRRFDRTDRSLDGFRPLVEHTLSVATLSQSKVGRPANWGGTRMVFAGAPFRI